jgi:hypothetical protein
MPGQTLVNSATPAFPFWVNDVGQDDLFSITVKSGSSVLAAGTVMGQFAGGGATKHLKHGAYANGNSDGTETAVGILYRDADPRTGDVLGSLMVRGDVRSGSLVGFDSNAATDLAGRFYFV